MDKSEKTVLLVFLVLLVSACCLLVVCGGLALAVGGIGGFSPTIIEDTEVPVVSPTRTELIPTQTPAPTSTPVLQEEVRQTFDTLNTLQQAIIPGADLIYLA